VCIPSTRVTHFYKPHCRDGSLDLSAADRPSGLSLLGHIVLNFVFWSLGFVWDFGFRAWDFFLVHKNLRCYI